MDHGRSYFRAQEAVKPADCRNDLGTLADPRTLTEPLDLGDSRSEVLHNFLRTMHHIRIAEEQIAELVLANLARCPCHLAIGQEAIATGVSSALRDSDKIFGGHRSHAHYLALGGGMHALMAEILGKSTGCSRGMGGSMHLHAAEVGFHGSVPIIAGTIPIAVGAAMAAKMDGAGDLAVAYFGDGAAEEGAVHEAFNLAAVYELPILFVCENNLYSSHLDIVLRQPSDKVSRFAEAHCINSRLIDGNDVLTVASTAAELCNEIRAGAGPALLEAVTYRWRGHVGPHENIDVGVRRSEKDVNAWKRRDPIARLALAMEAQGMLAAAEHEQIRLTAVEEVLAAIEQAKLDPYPSDAALLELVYE